MTFDLMNPDPFGADDVATVLRIVNRTGAVEGQRRPIELVLRGFAAHCLDAIDGSGHYRDASALARRVASGELGAEVLLEARRAASRGGPGALGALNYHLPSAALKFAALGVLSDTAAEAAEKTARNVALFRGFSWLHDLPDNPMAGQETWSGETMWAAWCAFAGRHQEGEQAEIARGARELAAELKKRLRAQLPAEVWDSAPARTQNPPQLLRSIDPTNVVPFRTGDIALDSVNRYYLAQGKWPFPVGGAGE